MVMGPWGQEIVRAEFGRYPDDLMKQTVVLDGYALHVPGAPVGLLDIETPTTWRWALDTWMCHCAEKAGAVLWDSTGVTNVEERDGSCDVMVSRDGERVALHARFVIGADGGNSQVRRALWPEVEPVALHGFRECYATELDVPKRRFNIFASLTGDPIYFTHQKGSHLLVEGVAMGGALPETTAQVRRLLVEHHGLDPELEPLWRDGCMQAALFHVLSAGSFRPARKNVLLVGDAGGLNVPVTGEGLATSLATGRHAAHAVIEASEGGPPAAETYLGQVDELLARYREIEVFGRQAGVAAAAGEPEAFSRAMLDSWERALHLYT
jgi:flavin-dependent dehydrogenase